MACNCARTCLGLRLPTGSLPRAAASLPGDRRTGPHGLRMLPRSATLRSAPTSTRAAPCRSHRLWRHISLVLIHDSLFETYCYDCYDCLWYLIIVCLIVFVCYVCKEHILFETSESFTHRGRRISLPIASIPIAGSRIRLSRSKPGACTTLTVSAPLDIRLGGAAATTAEAAMVMVLRWWWWWWCCCCCCCC